MKLGLVDRFRVWFGNSSLDWLEKAWRFNGGALAQRQRTREHQHEEADKAHEHTRLPKDIQIDYLCFRLVEIFPVEEATRLQRGLKKLLPFLESEVWHRDFSKDFSKQAKRIQAGMYWNLGRLVKESEFLFFPSESRKMPELPEEVSFVDVWLHHLYPSVFVVTFDVYLQKDATQRLLRVHGKKYLSTLRFLRLIPWGIQGASYAGENTSERAIKHEVLRWFEDLRKKVENCISPYVRGYFLEQGSRKSSALPAIEVVALQGTPSEPDAFEKWFRDQRRWWDSLGFGHDFFIYKSKEAMYVDPADDYPHGRSVIRVVPLWESYKAAVADFRLKSGDRFAVTHDIAEWLNALLPLFVILEYLESVQDNIEKLRQETFRKMKPGLHLAKRMNRYIRLSDAIQRESMLLERIALEYEQDRINIERSVTRAFSELTISDTHIADKVGATLSERLLKSVDYYLDFLKKNLGFVTNSFSQYLSTRNMKVMYQLQRRMFWLTVFVVIATVITLIPIIKPNIPLLKKWFGY